MAYQSHIFVSLNVTTDHCYNRHMKNILKLLEKSASEAYDKNKHIIYWRKKYPAFFSFVERRLSPSNQYGFSFSIGIILSIAAFFYFSALTQNILAKDPFVEADIRLMNLAAALRNISTAKILLLFTYLGNWQFIFSLAIITAFALLMLKEKRKLTFLIIGLAGGELLYTIFKLLLHRTRPDIGFSLIPRNGYAFPSGHATMSLIFYGMISYGLLKITKRWWVKASLIILTTIIIFLVGFSRIYLGVHWVSNVLAGWMFGIAFLVLLITFFNQYERFKPETKTECVLPKKLVFLAVIFLLILEGTFFYFFYTKHPLIESKNYQAEAIIIPLSSNFRTIVSTDNFPKFSETIVGEKMEPISFIMIGTNEQIIQTFQKAGWLIADEPQRFRNLYHLFIAAIFNQPYPTAPVTPSFLNAQPNIIAFEKPTAANTVRQRHHIRLWLTNFKADSTAVWVATASFDDGLRYFITHKIHPDIDTERDFIKDELVGTDLIKDEKQVQLVKPLLGKNQSGDQFFTDGKAYVIFIK